jgi:hypothetical protein
MQVDSPQEVEKLNSMLGELREVFVDHLESALEDVLHNYGNLIFHERLRSVSKMPKA